MLPLLLESSAKMAVLGCVGLEALMITILTMFKEL